MSPAALAARDSAAVFVLEGRTHLEITGQDRAKFLHNFCTNDIQSLRAGQACEAFVCNVKGRVLGHVTVFVDERSLWLETVPGAGPKLLAHLERYIITDDVQLHDRTAELCEACVAGPHAAAVLARLLGENDHNGPKRRQMESLPCPGISLGAANGCGLRVVDWLGVRCYLPVTTAADADQGIQALISAGAVPGTSSDWEALRIDAGFPQYGSDITDDNLPQEVGRTAKCISFRKGCYLGQEPIARLDAMGHTNRELRRLISPGDRVPPRGTELLDSATRRPVGCITSAAGNPFGAGFVALGYLKTGWLVAETKVLCGDDEFTVRPDNDRSLV